MIKEFKATISFYYDVEFEKCPKIIIYSNLLKLIKKNTCINTHKNCNKCSIIDKCLYFYISGKNLDQYPGILLKRDSIEKKRYKANESLEINFYVIGEICTYIDYLNIFFEQIQKVEHYQFRLVNKEIIICNTKDKYNGFVKVFTPINKLNLKNMIKYYCDNYNLSIDNNYEIREIESYYRKDNSRYLIMGKMNSFSGVVGKYKVLNFPKILLEIGISDNNFIGGGRAYEIKD